MSGGLNWPFKVNSVQDFQILFDLLSELKGY